MIASLAGMNNIFADVVGTSTDLINPLLIVLAIAGPLAAGWVTYMVIRRGSDGPDTADEPPENAGPRATNGRGDGDEDGDEPEDVDGDSNGNRGSGGESR